MSIPIQDGPQGRNHRENLGATAPMVGRICPPLSTVTTSVASPTWLASANPYALCCRYKSMNITATSTNHRRNSTQCWPKTSIVSWVRFVHFLGEVTARQFCFEIYWPLFTKRKENLPAPKFLTISILYWKLKRILIKVTLQVFPLQKIQLSTAPLYIQKFERYTV